MTVAFAAPAVATSLLDGVEILTQPTALADIAADHAELFERAGQPQQVFQQPAVLAHWARPYGDCGERPFFVTVRRHGRLVLAWPLIEQRRARLRLLRQMGTPVAQFEDLVCEDGPDGVRALQCAWLAIASSGADLLTMRRQRRDSRFGRLAAGPKLVLVRAEAPRVDLSTRVEGDQPGPAYDGRERSAFRRRLRRLSELGSVALTTHCPGARAAALADQAIAFKRDWLARHNIASPTVESPRFAEFFRSLAADVSGPLRVCAIEIDGRAAAIDLSFDCKGTSFGHVLASDPALEREGLGSVLVHHVFASSAGRGNRFFDMLAPADAYKLRHADATTAVEDIAYPFTAAGRLYAGSVLKRGMPAARRIAKALPPRLVRGMLGD